jgi:hypothetical protein
MDKIAIIITLFLMIIFLCSNLFAQEASLKVEYTSYNLRDPLKNPLLKTEAARVSSKPEIPEDISLPEEFKVKGIVWGIEPVKAIINDEVVGRGDSILDVQILDIKKDGVYLLYKGKKFIVKP